MRQWPEVRDGGWLVDMVGKDLANFWVWRLEATYKGQLDAWDYQYYLSCWLDGSLAVAPNLNLVTNVGIGEDATHTIEPAPYLHCPAETMRFPLVHPPFMVCDRVSDRETFKRRLLPEDGSMPRKIVRHMHYLLTGKRDTASVKLVQGRLVEHPARGWNGLWRRWVIKAGHGGSTGWVAGLPKAQFAVGRRPWVRRAR
jgi:hypothetical protein